MIEINLEKIKSLRVEVVVVVVIVVVVVVVL